MSIAIAVLGRKHGEAKSRERSRWTLFRHMFRLPRLIFQEGDITLQELLALEEALYAEYLAAVEAGRAGTAAAAAAPGEA